MKNSGKVKSQKIIPSGIFRIATRGSALAMAQVEIATRAFRAKFPELKFETVIVKSDADRAPDARLANVPGVGIFSKALEDALLAGKADAAVHSLKDLPVEPPGAPSSAGLVLAAFMEREDPRDCLVSRAGLRLADLPPSAAVGTSSPRRRSQLARLRGDLRFADIRGNVETRVRKVKDGAYDAAVVALAGLKRLGIEKEAVQIFEIDEIMSDPGQGCIVVQTRSGDARARMIAMAAEHQRTRWCVMAERALLAGLGGGCRVPIAAYGRMERGGLVLDAVVVSPDGKSAVRDRETGLLEEAEDIGARLAVRMLANGARKLI